MRASQILLPALLAMAIGVAPRACAKTVSTKGNSPTQVEGRCGNSPGGVFWPTSATGTYGCMNKDGSGIVCGGTGKDKNTCDTWPAGLKAKLPVRAKLRQDEAVHLNESKLN